jgi:bifunctional non-homologous end joining protein LigD
MTTDGSGDGGRTPPPKDVRPMLATAAPSLPREPGYAFEMKWDGIRALALVEAGAVAVISRNGNDITDGYPELAALGSAGPARDLLLDGEIVALDDQGHSSFQLLQSRMHVREPLAVRRLMATVPVVYMIFDVLWLDGSNVMAHPYLERRALLEGLALAGTSWQTPPIVDDDGDTALTASRELGFEGVVAKAHRSTYRPGRSREWLKVKHQLRQELVVGGWQPGAGSREGRVGSLLVGYHDAEGLRYAGKVGTGFTDAELDRLTALLAPRERDTSPFVDPDVPRDARFCTPDLVAEVRFSGWTSGHRVRQPAYLGLRDDKDATSVLRET